MGLFSTVANRLYKKLLFTEAGDGMQLATVGHVQNARNVTTCSLGLMPVPQAA